MAQSFTAHPNWKITMCLVDQGWEANSEVRHIVDTCQSQGVDIIITPRHVFNTISVVENGIGLALVVSLPPKLTPPPLQQNSILLDKVQDPGNVGTILRTAAAAGVAQVFCSTGCASVYSPKVLRAAMGAHTVLDIFENCNLIKVINDAQAPIYATSLEATTSLYDLDLTKPSSWLMGSEGQGVSPDLLTLNIQKIIIPQQPQVESLNVSAATAVCLFEQLRQQLIAKK